MAFLDNSGDIILDAVLTDTGRKRLSEGNFQIRKFALGDDEIQYNLYDKDHPSGSAYYDLEILQTPVETAHTKASNIHYGLLSLTNRNILYMPSLVLNEKTDVSIVKYNKVLYLAVNQQTATKITNSSNIDSKYVLQANQSTPARGIVIESGIDSTEIKGTPTNRAAYLQATNLMDESYLVTVDNRFINNVWGPGTQATFSNNSTGDSSINFGPLQPSRDRVASRQMSNYVQYTARGTGDLVFYYGTLGSNTDTNISAINGPRSTVTKLNLNVYEELRSESDGTRSDLWSKYGQLTQNVFSTGQLYDILDTFVQVAGSNTNAGIQIPVRLIRYISG